MNGSRIFLTVFFSDDFEKKVAYAIEGIMSKSIDRRTQSSEERFSSGRCRAGRSSGKPLSIHPLGRSNPASSVWDLLSRR